MAFRNQGYQAFRGSDVLERDWRNFLTQGDLDDSGI